MEKNMGISKVRRQMFGVCLKIPINNKVTSLKEFNRSRKERETKEMMRNRGQELEESEYWETTQQLQQTRIKQVRCSQNVIFIT